MKRTRLLDERKVNKTSHDYHTAPLRGYLVTIRSSFGHFARSNWTPYGALNCNEALWNLQYRERSTP